MSAENKSEQMYESLKDLEVLDLVTKKASAIKELDKTLKQAAAMDASKAGERAKLTKVLEKINDALLLVSTAERLLKEKDF